jgi:hypothetical protein
MSKADKPWLEKYQGKNFEKKPSRLKDFMKQLKEELFPKK